MIDPSGMEPETSGPHEGGPRDDSAFH